MSEVDILFEDLNIIKKTSNATNNIQYAKKVINVENNIELRTVQNGFSNYNKKDKK